MQMELPGCVLPEGFKGERKSLFEDVENAFLLSRHQDKEGSLKLNWLVCLFIHLGI